MTILDALETFQGRRVSNSMLPKRAVLSTCSFHLSARRYYRERRRYVFHQATQECTGRSIFYCAKEEGGRLRLMDIYMNESAVYRLFVLLIT